MCVHLCIYTCAHTQARMLLPRGPRPPLDTRVEVLAAAARRRAQGRPRRRPHPGPESAAVGGQRGGEASHVSPRACSVAVGLDTCALERVGV